MKPKRRRRNPSWLQPGMPLSCVVALQELERVGVSVSVAGNWVIVDPDDLHRVRGADEVFKSAQHACARLAVARIDPKYWKKIAREFVRVAASVAFEDAWRSEQESRASDGFRKRALPSSTPRSATVWAKAMLESYEQLNDVPIGLAWDILRGAAEAHVRELERRGYAWGNERKQISLAWFAEVTALQAMGHGIGWGDWFPEMGFEVPQTEDYL